MSDSYSLPSHKARLCRIAGAAFLFFALCSILGALLVSVAPGPHLDCVNGPCRWTLEPERLLDDEARIAVMANPVTEARFDAHVEQTPVRAGLAGITIIEQGPFAFLLFGVGCALRRLGARRGDPLAEALPWLRRASIAAMLAAVSGLVGNSLRQSLLSGGTPEGWQVILMFDLVPIGTALMLAVAAYATIWAIEAGLRAQRDLAEIV